ncbi:bifunctional DNA-formamidopyrimidine glycosylase/DNA-(apurinic or apyrimidinic site) lyase [Legionella spiritensis]|uniref:bifunctional DNA-formamidopyrimidine glycosylase/DNA-(apurinic or apyrimidinic site) lyase n=1 Tax=Legionella spiritensis TaxID=452 RepID=UPI000F6DE2D1|nr:bifunctional DNA-formamidopyrimidine glycosylase/DNA-(apurinic or apyrimidinic site) lyase [Legionella spiritensis]VEG91341.1 formamidopyrimidine-DNA glycosylase [Legionella spiritensis]
MPELPEVETTAQGIRPHILHQTISEIIVREPRLRRPVPKSLHENGCGQTIEDVTRRAKYIILHLTKGYLLIHLGMTGHFRLFNTGSMTPGKHDHIDLCLQNNLTLRYNDPRRFGLWLATDTEPSRHPLLAALGPEPLTDDFNPAYLYARARGRKQSIKSFIMDNRIVVGVGNIYASECLFLAGIHPLTSAGALDERQAEILTHYIKETLQRAIQAGGTTLKDFYASDGKPGYFALELQVYGRKNQPCFSCGNLIAAETIAGRTSSFCPHCQPRAR